jgi:hypothetical protein
MRKGLQEEKHGHRKIELRNNRPNIIQTERKLPDRNTVLQRDAKSKRYEHEMERF